MHLVSRVSLKNEAEVSMWGEEKYENDKSLLNKR